MRLRLVAKLLSVTDDSAFCLRHLKEIPTTFRAWANNGHECTALGDAHKVDSLRHTHILQKGAVLTQMV